MAAGRRADRFRCPGVEAGGLLRGVHDYAVQHSATPLQSRVEELAAGARISLASPMIPTAATVPAAFAGLTPRETEVLAHLVANRTYAEIARDSPSARRP